MTEQEPRSGNADGLHRRAEQKAQADEATVQKPQSSKETRQALHELRVHQIELELQKEQLRRAQVELEGDFR